MRSGLFDSEITGYDGEGMPIFDRAESAAFFARYFSNFLSNGVFADPADGLQIVPGSGRTVRIMPGYCYIRGYMGWQEKEEDLSLEGVASGTRTDGIVLRLSLQERKIYLGVLKGTVELTRTDDIYELLLAEVTIQENAVQIVDKRADVAVCGFVSGLAQLTALKNEVNQKAPLDNPNFTGTVTGISKDYSATLYASSWNSSAPYTQTVSVSGITSGMKPIISPVYSTTTATAIVQKESWSYVCKAVSGTNQIFFTCFEDKPSVNIPIQIKVVQ